MFNKGKTKLKCFNNKNYPSSKANKSFSKYASELQSRCFSKTFSKQFEKHFVNAKTEKNEESHTSLVKKVPIVNEPNTSHEKSTMTDPHLSKKGKVNQATGDIINIQTILQSISANKADNKVPIVILSKSPSQIKKETPILNSHSSPSDYNWNSSEDEDQQLNEKIQILEQNLKRLASDKKLKLPSESGSLILDAENDNNVSSKGLQEIFSDDDSSSDNENQVFATSHNFKGFSTSKAKSNLQHTTSNINNAKKLLNFENKESEVNSFDHSYSHGGKEFNKTTSPTVKNEYQDKDYPYPFVSRSVFGSTSSSKVLPDIMLHNDKINILRQMSKVFNDEKPIPSNHSPTKTVKADNKQVDSIESSTKLIGNKVQIKQILSNSDCISSSSNISGDTNSISEPITPENLQTGTDSTISTKGQKVPNDYTGPNVNAGNLYLKQKDAIKSESIKANMKDESEMPLDSEASSSAPVHMVSSHCLDRNETIKVTSYKGIQGELVDIIDGFTFVSFLTDKDMKQYDPRKTKGKMKKKGKKRFGTKPIERIYRSEGIMKKASNNIQLKEKNLENSLTNINDPPTKGVLLVDANNLKINDKSSNKLKMLDSKENNSVSLKTSDSTASCSSQKLYNRNGAFSSHDLEKYLSEDAKLKVSYPIPKSRTAEKESIIAKESKLRDEEKKEKLEILTTIPNFSDQIEDTGDAGPKIIEETCSKTSNPILGSGTSLKANTKTEPKQKGSTMYVKRAGKLLPLSEVLQKNKSKTFHANEIVYVYNRGKLITLGGSLAKVNPSKTTNIRARVALPVGREMFSKHTVKKLQTVKINEDLANFALSALKPPTVVESEKPTIHKVEAPVKLSKENILDILTAKFSIKKSVEPSKTVNSSLMETKQNGSNISPSKIMWNQDDILKKSKMFHSTEQSKALRKNINRFPSLSREMKRLNMNYIQYDQESASDDNEIPTVGPCKNRHCSLGCICDSLKVKKRVRDHCGKPDCMFVCNCRSETLCSETSGNSMSIFNLDQDHQMTLALKEKDFKKTIVQSSSGVYLIDGEKKKRDRKMPERYRDSLWKKSALLSDGDESNSSSSFDAKETPSTYYRKNTKPFRLNVPWYDIQGVSAWCMVHSCYDCNCLLDSFDRSQSSSPTEELKEVSSSVKELTNNSSTIETPPTELKISDTIPPSVAESRIICLDIRFDAFKASSENGKGRWFLKHYIHNADIHSSRTNGYDFKNMTVMQIDKPHSVPLPRQPYTMGLTVKNSFFARASQANSGTTKKPAEFYVGLGLNALYPKLFKAKVNESDTEKGQTAIQNTNILPKNCQESQKGETLTQPDVKQEKFTLPILEDQSHNTSSINPHQQSIQVLIDEEDKRGELELDLITCVPDKLMLVSESRFRKLINMTIIGIVGLNKKGRCILGTATSSEDFAKMQRVQFLISNQSIDVGPNMREIFSSSAPIDSQRVRYVMIRCNNASRWEIVGLVQRKEGVAHGAKTNKKPRLLTKPASGGSLMPSDNRLATVTHNTGEENLILESSNGEDGLPRIQSVSGGDPISMNYIEQPSNTFLSGYSIPNSSDADESCKTFTSTGTITLNQKSAKVFGQTLQETLPINRFPSSFGSLVTNSYSGVNLSSKIRFNKPVDNVGSFKLLNNKELIGSAVSKAGLINKDIKHPTQQCIPVSQSPVLSSSCTSSIENKDKYLNMLNSKSDTTLMQQNSADSSLIVSPVTNSNLSSAGSRFKNVPKKLKTVLKYRINTGNSVLRKTSEKTKLVSLCISGIEVLPASNKSIVESQNEDTQAKPLSATSTEPLPLAPVDTIQSPPFSKTLPILPRSPEIKYVSTGECNYTAVDLSLKFESVKLHWLFGAIKRNTLLNVYRKSKASNTYISLSGKSNSKQVKFFALNKDCELDSNTKFAAVILSSTIEGVTKASKLSVKELFRSNISKYLIKDREDLISSYTYDVKGKFLLKIASKSLKNNKTIVGTGMRVPINKLRDLSQLGTLSLNPVEEVTIDSSDEETPSESQPQKSNQILSFNVCEEPSLSSTTPDLITDIIRSQTSNNSQQAANCNVNKTILLTPRSDLKRVRSSSLDNFNPNKNSESEKSGTSSPQSEEISSKKRRSTDHPYSSHSSSLDLALSSLSDEEIIVDNYSTNSANLNKPVTKGVKRKLSLSTEDSDLMNHPLKVQNVTKCDSASKSSESIMGSQSPSTSKLGSQTFRPDKRDRSPFGQEIFSKAPQFWAMDGVERHNTLERIRRKGLAKMFSNLHNIVRRATDEVKLPPKHIVLKSAEDAIKKLQQEEVSLNKEEIALRNKRMELLNFLSDLLKNTEGETLTDVENWISTNILNPTAKEEFEKNWKPNALVFEDEPVKSQTVGQITLKGSDITSYFEAHTSGAYALMTSPQKPTKKVSPHKRFMIRPSGSKSAGLLLSPPRRNITSKKPDINWSVKKSASHGGYSDQDITLEDGMASSVVPPPIDNFEDFINKEELLSAESSTAVDNLIRSEDIDEATNQL